MFVRMLLFVALAGLSASAQDRRNPPGQPKPYRAPKIDNRKIDKAINSGIKYLKKYVAQPFVIQKRRQIDSDLGVPPRSLYELIVWTFIHAKVKPTDSQFRTLFKMIMEEPVRKTYNMALLAMICSKLDPIRYAPVIKECAEFFVDTQYPNGQWSYPYDGSYRGPQVSAARKSLIDPGARSKRRRKRGEAPKPPPKVSVSRTSAKIDYSGVPDNSNSQYAVLGIRACHEAGIVFPKEMIERAEKWLEKCQNYDGGWPYLLPQGVDSEGAQINHPSYGSMTLGALGSLAILKSIQKKPVSKAMSIVNGKYWMKRRFAVKTHPGMDPRYNPIKEKSYEGELMYYLYSMERAGDMMSVERYGERLWYAEGADFLLKIQKRDGSWKDPSTESLPVATCFAILFLKRVTSPIIETQGVAGPPPEPTVKDEDD